MHLELKMGNASVREEDVERHLARVGEAGALAEVLEELGHLACLASADRRTALARAERLLLALGHRTARRGDGMSGASD